jgi:hypothetical protein
MIGSDSRSGKNDALEIGATMLTASRMCGMPVGALRFTVSILLICCISVGCVSTTSSPSEEAVSYRDLCGVSAEDMSSMSAEALSQWIEDKYSCAASVSQQSDGSILYVWDSEGLVGNAYVKDDHVVRIELHNVAIGPTLEQVVDGLGAPEMVNSYYWPHQPQGYTVGLDYWGTGVTVYSHAVEDRADLMHQGRIAFALSEESVVMDIVCYRAGSMRYVLQNAFLLVPESVDFQMSRRVPWTGFGELVFLD